MCVNECLENWTGKNASQEKHCIHLALLLSLGLSISFSMEILLNGELSTNNLEITFSKVFILNSDTNTNNIVKSSTNHIVKELFLLR